jgi:hypothetical protein
MNQVKKLSVYEDYADQMSMLRAAFNRVMNFCDSGETELEERKKLEQIVKKGFQAQCTRGFSAVYLLLKACESKDVKKISDCCAALHKLNRQNALLGQLWEGPIIEDRKGPDDYDDDFEPVNIDPRELSTKISTFLENCKIWTVKLENLVAIENANSNAKKMVKHVTSQ